MDLKQLDGVLYQRYDIERIFLDAICGNLEMTQELEEYLQQVYNILPGTTYGLLSIWLGDLYENYQEIISRGLETLTVNDSNMSQQCVRLPNYQMQVLIFYPLGEENQYLYYQKSTLNEVRLFTPQSCIVQAERCVGIENLKTRVDIMNHNLEWNLVFGNRVLINSQKIKALHLVPLHYPKELSGEMEKAIIQNNSLAHEKCFEKLMQHCRNEVHTPEEIKGVCLQHCSQIKKLSKKIADKENEVAYFHLLNTVSRAKYWRQIWEAMLEYMKLMFGENNKEAQYSLLVGQAKLLVLNHYSEGITLEEIAEKLHVSEEYLSQLFKKETGLTFSETIKGYRMERIARLLVTSQLKTKEIAKLTGYADPKYMSRVFKEATGMSPNEYRKVNIL